jgi:hypothetical protein
MYLFVSLCKYLIKVRLFQNFSFGTTTLDLIEKAGFRPLFRKPVLKLARVLEQAQAALIYSRLNKSVLPWRSTSGFLGEYV